MNAILKREELHKEARGYLAKGQYESTVQILTSAINQFGPHVGVLADLTTAYYLQSKMDHFEAALEKLRNEFEICKSILKKNHYFKTAMILAKFFEEIGEVALALDLYKEIQEKTDFNDLRIIKKVKIQKLRLQSFLSIFENLETLYNDCMRITEFDDDLQVELEHGLMLSEFQLFGYASAKTRLLNFLGRPQTSDYDHRLFLGDFIEEAINRGTAQEDNDIPVSNLQNGDAFEQTLLGLYLDPPKVLLPQQINQLTSQISKMGLLRLLILSLRRHNGESYQEEIRKRIFIIIQSLSARSRQLLQKKWNLNDISTQPMNNYKLYLHSNYLIWNNQKISLNSHRTLLKILEFFSHKKQASLEEFVSSVFETQFTESTYDRIRISFSRANKVLTIWLGQTNLLKISKTHVLWNSSIVIESNNLKSI